MRDCITHLELVQSYTPTILQQKFLRRLLKKHQAASLVERRDRSLTLMKENRKERRGRQGGVEGEGQKEGRGGRGRRGRG